MKTASSRKITAEASQNARLMRSDRLFLPSLPVNGRGGRRRSAPSAVGRSCGSIVRQMLHGVRAAGVEAAAGGRRRSGSARRRRARCARARARAPGPAPAPPRAATACTGGAGRSKIASRGPSSTILPRYMTATRAAICRTTARSCAMKRSVRPSSSWRSLSRLTIWAWIETSSARHGLVGDDEVRARARARARCRCAGAGRRRTRAGSAVRRPLGQADAASSSSRTRARRSARDPTPCARSGSAIDLLDLHARVERRVGVLEDHLRAPAERAQLVRRRAPRGPRRRRGPFPRRARTGGAGSARWSSSRSPTRRRARASRRAAIVEARPGRRRAAAAPVARQSRADTRNSTESPGPRRAARRSCRGAHRTASRTSAQQAAAWPSLARPLERRILDLAAVEGERAARAERDSRSGGSRSGAARRGSTAAGSCDLPVDPGHASAGARACTGAAARRRPTSVGPSSTIRPAYITAQAVGHACDDAEVVRDQDERHAALARARASAARAAAPGSSRRAPSSARRRSGQSGSGRARSRRRPAGAARPRAGAGYCVKRRARLRHADLLEQLEPRLRCGLAAARGRDGSRGSP